MTTFPCAHAQRAPCSLLAAQLGSELEYLNALTEGLAVAYGPTVRVNTLMPGPFLTDVSKAWNLAEFNPFSRHPLGRAGEPSEIVGAALFLMSDASSFTTGSILRADGGLPG
jgi:NAD(P)-dependent dehydrogenase (short-subunit alcohol dehydrogenase family)